MLDPLLAKRLQRFRSIKRGYYSFLFFVILLFLSCFLELFISNRALLVRYQGEYYFPSYGAIIPGTTFGKDYKYETNYRDLAKEFEEKGEGNFVILPIVPFGANEVDLTEGRYPPYPPSLTDKHYIGTDTSGRDILARLFYGFRTAIFFSLGLLVTTYGIGIFVGSLMGYYGGKFDLFVQRLIEIWTNIPYLYVIIIVSSIVVPNFYSLLGILVFFGWTSMTWYMRTSIYKEKNREYVLAARATGCSSLRIIFRHILPNTVSVIVTFIPFSVSSGIVALTSLDFLGFGLPPPTPSWGELLRIGMSNMYEAQWIVLSVVIAMIVVLSIITFIGEAVREAFDPKKFAYYE